MTESHEHYMRLALREAARGGRAGEVPVGANEQRTDGNLAGAGAASRLAQGQAHVVLVRVRHAGLVGKKTGAAAGFAAAP